MTALHDLTRRALDQAGVPHGATLVVAASGGLDSTVLLHLLGDLGHPLVVAHVDHGARGAQSDGDRDAVRVWAETRGFPFEVLTLDPEALKAGAQGFQGEARKSRMAWFDALCDTHSAFAFVTGHHADDQAETWMLHAMRSLDPLALAGMSLRDGRMIRPLLEATKAQLLALAQHHGWSWREDQSNDSSVYLRNRVRHEVLPLLDDLRPGTTKHLQGTGKTHVRTPRPDGAPHRGRTTRGRGPAWIVVDRRVGRTSACPRSVATHVEARGVEPRSNGRGLGPVDVSSGKLRLLWKPNRGPRTGPSEGACRRDECVPSHMSPRSHL